MIFDNQHPVIIDSLSSNEARAFVKFLESEIIRHQDDIFQAQELINEVKMRWCPLCGEGVIWDDAIRQSYCFYCRAIIREKNSLLFGVRREAR